MTPAQVQELIDMVKAASPVLWQAAREQVRVQIGVDYFWGIFAVAVALLALVLSTQALRMLRYGFTSAAAKGAYSMDGEGWQIGGVIGLVLCSIMLIASLITAGGYFTDAYQKQNAPTYAAVQALTQLLPGK